MNETTGVNRREFVKSTATAALAAQAFGILNARGQAAGRTFKVALIGCGGRGTGALDNHLEAAKTIGVNIEVVALADFFKDRVSGTGQKHNVPAERCFTGATAYQKLLEVPSDIVLMATPPNFRPVHFEASVQAGRHIFTEKPVGVDPVGIRRFLAAGEASVKKGLSVVAGTQRRHQDGYLRTAGALKNGAIGKIVGGSLYWCGGALWYKTRDQGEGDDSYMIRNWTSFAETSGDHIVEQHVHNLDIANWYIGHPPESAIGFGGRARRKTGDMFDFFSIDFDYGDGVHIHSMCRQVNGTYGRVSEWFTGTEGSTGGGGGVKRWDGKNVEIPEVKLKHENPYVQEHIDLLESIIAGKPINEAKNVAESTLTAILGRISAYTGQVVRWVDVMSNQSSPFYNLALSPSPEDFEKGTVKAPADDVAPVPGTA
jgi:myo-inositol 2-dehydrogenase / D-chiro-inositol 1-dehydrogenase